ncbi:hypothetical protein pb186bvf_009623 [Paramecium bursaria]
MDDPRFQRIKKDPRFISLPKKEKKILLEPRFKEQLKRKEFSTKPLMDKYGNKNQIETGLEEHYDLSEASEPSIQSEIEESVSIDEEIQQDYWEKDEEELIKAPIAKDVSARIALQNYEWYEIKLKDLMVLFTSFCPPGKSIKQISLYVSEFGKQKLEEESNQGPQIFKEENFNNRKNKEPIKQVNELIVKEDDDDIDVDPQKLRQYERDRLKYYYAVIECDSVETADAIYQQTNGNEFELSNLKLDLRFIPDEVKLPKENLKEVCNSVPTKVTQKLIQNRAGGHTNVKLTWEEHKPRTNYWQKGNFDKMDWDELIGEKDDVKKDEDEEDQDYEQPQEDAPEQDDWRNSFNKKSKSKLSVTFNSGFNPDGHNVILERRTKCGKHAPREPDDFFVGFDKDEDENKTNYKQRKLERKQKLKQKQQLELLVDNNKVDFQFNPNDERFQAIKSKPEYALDPTNQKFESNKKTKF